MPCYRTEPEEVPHVSTPTPIPIPYPNRTEPNRTEPALILPNRTEPNRTEPSSVMHSTFRQRVNYERNFVAIMTDFDSESEAATATATSVVSATRCDATLIN